MSGIILASGSASRRQILEGAGIPFTVRRPGVDEDTLKLAHKDLTPAALALELGRAKALSVKAPGALVIGADQVLEFEGRPFDKPRDLADLKLRLHLMAGKPHFLRGGLVLARDGKVVAEITDSSTLRMRDLTAKEVDGYLAAVSEDALHTVGGYMLEGLGARLFERVEGDFFSILGLPLFPLLEALRREGAIPW